MNHAPIPDEQADANKHSGPAWQGLVLGASRAFLLRAALVAVNLVYIPLLAALLGAARYGTYAEGLAGCLVFLTVSFAGANWRLSVEVARDPPDSDHLIGRFLAVRYVTAIGASVACFVWGWIWLGDVSSRWLVSILAVVVLVRSLASLFNAVLVGCGKNDVSIGVEFVGRLTEIVLAAGGIALFGWGAEWVALALLLSWTMQLTYLWVKAPAYRHPPRILDAVASVLRLSWSYAWLGTMVALMNQSALLLLPENARGDHVLGWVGLAQSVVSAGNSLVVSILGSLSRPMARSSLDGTSFLLKVFSAGMALAAIAGLSSYVFIALAGPSVVMAFMGSDFLGIVDLAGPISCLVAALMALTIGTNVIGFLQVPTHAALAVTAGIALIVALRVLAGDGISVAGFLYLVACGAGVSVFMLAVLLFQSRTSRAPA
jgi:O-antigen/teichoic acid export membrane protein